MLLSSQSDGPDDGLFNLPFRGNLPSGLFVSAVHDFNGRPRTHFLRPCRVEKPVSAVSTNSVCHLPVSRMFGLIQFSAAPGTYSFHRSLLLETEGCNSHTITGLVGNSNRNLFLPLRLRHDSVARAGPHGPFLQRADRATLCGIARRFRGTDFSTHPAVVVVKCPQARGARLTTGPGSCPQMRDENEAQYLNGWR
jgi:hypothetical protein